MNTRLGRFKHLGTGRVLVFLTAVVAMLAGPKPAHAIGPICRVAAGAAAGGDGLSWATAFNTLYTEHPECTELWVKKGVYKPFSYPAGSIHISPGMQIYGGFDGTETLRSQRDPALNVTILSGDIDGDDINTDGNFIDESYGQIKGTNNKHIVTFYGDLTSPTVLDGFTITGGDATGDVGGGGLVCDASGTGAVCSPTLANLVFSGNYGDAGGAILLEAQNGGISSPTLTNVTFHGNGAGHGGAMMNAGWGGITNPTLTNVTFDYNRAVSGGGALQNESFNGGVAGSSSPQLNNVTFYGNFAGTAGGAMYNNSSFAGISSPKLNNVTFFGNGDATYGGAIYNEAASTGVSNPALTNTILWGDWAANGNEIWNVSAHPTITYSDVQGGCASITGAICGSGNRNAVPVFKPLANYGGSVQTLPVLKGSPTVDTGTNTGCALTDARGIPRPKDGDGNGTIICDMGATESRYITTALQSSATYDGWVLESGKNTGLGGSLNSTATTFNLGDDAANRQFRGILSFKANLPPGATIVAATLKIQKASLVGSDPFSVLGQLLVDIQKGGLGHTAALENADFQAPASKLAAASIPNSPTATGWYIKRLASTNFIYINQGGLTQIRLRFAAPNNNDSAADLIRFYSGNAIADSRPQLVISYYVP